MQGYEVHIDNDFLPIPNPLVKLDANYLEVSFCEADLHADKAFVNGTNNIILKVIDVFKPNKLQLNYTTLICDIWYENV